MGNSVKLVSLQFKICAGTVWRFLLSLNSNENMHQKLFEKFRSGKLELPHQPPTISSLANFDFRAVY